MIAGPERLGSYALHVWLFGLREELEFDPPDLEDTERARADDFRFEDDRRRFLVGRTRLHEVRRRYADDTGLTSSLSHSGDLVAVAVARRAVGVDVEQLRGAEPEPELVARVCTAALRRRIEEAPPDERERIFLSEWVRKEALGKALGVGLDLDLTPRALALFPRAGGARHRGLWRVHGVETPDGYAGAVAARGEVMRIVVRRSPG